MRKIALKMLFGDATKYVGLVFGVAFTTLLITQQGAMFTDLMVRTAAVIADTASADIWVADPLALHIDETRPLRDTAVGRVRGVPGVAWAVPLYESDAAMKTGVGSIINGLVLGVDDVTLIGAPEEYAMGQLSDLRRADAIAINVLGYHKLWPGEPLRLGRTMELNEHRAQVVAISEVNATFGASILIHTRYSQAINFVPQARNQLTFVIARAKQGESAEAVAQRITDVTGMHGYTSRQFTWKTIWYYLENTGIPLSFGIVILIGLIVGIVVIGLTFNMFVSDNIRQYGTLKALGLTNVRLIWMVLTQAAMVACVGYGLGIGGAALFFRYATRGELEGFNLPWYISAGDAVVTIVIILVAIAFGLKRVLVLDPAIVFRN